jgi:hypothetical protein
VKTIKVKTRNDIPQNYTGIVVYSDGAKVWYLNGRLHREDGPAIVRSDGAKYWWLNNGKCHREDGPAVVWANGGKQWWLNYKQVDKQAVELYYMLKYKKVLDL